MFHFLPHRRKKTDEKSGKDGGIVFTVSTSLAADPIDSLATMESVGAATSEEQRSSMGVAVVVEARRDAEGQTISKAFTERKVQR